MTYYAIFFADNRLHIEPVSKYYEVAKGSTVNAMCNVTSADKYTLSYKKVQGNLPANAQVIGGSGTLVFLLSSAAGSGEYTCEATSSTGTHTASFYGKLYTFIKNKYS